MNSPCENSGIVGPQDQERAKTAEERVQSGRRLIRDATRGKLGPEMHVLADVQGP